MCVHFLAENKCRTVFAERFLDYLATLSPSSAHRQSPVPSPIPDSLYLVPSSPSLCTALSWVQAASSPSPWTFIQPPDLYSHTAQEPTCPPRGPNQDPGLSVQPGFPACLPASPQSPQLCLCWSLWSPPSNEIISSLEVRLTPDISSFGKPSLSPPSYPGEFQCSAYCVSLRYLHFQRSPQRGTF